MQVELTVSQSTITSKRRNPALFLALGIGSMMLIATLCVAHMEPSSSSNRGLLEVPNSGLADGSEAAGIKAEKKKHKDKKINLDTLNELLNSGSTNTGNTIVESAPTTSTTSDQTTGSTTSQSAPTTTKSTTTPATSGSTTTGSTTTGSTTAASTTATNTLTYQTGQSCTNGATAYLTGLTAAQKAEILAAHNNFRSTIALGKAPGQPGATNMLEMIWDDNVAAVAQSWADECVFEHTPESGLQTSKFSALGQNLDLDETSNKLKTLSMTSMVEDWYNEVKLYNGQSGPVSSYEDDGETGHYTQLAWANSYSVGCGFKVYNDGGMYTYQLTCNYGPAGNYIGEKMYTSGTFEASKCKNGASTTYQGLCNN